MIEHVLVNGNSQCENDCISEMNKKGILMNASTGLNMINYFTMGISEDLEKMIKFIVETTVSHCFKLKKGAYFLPDNNIKNTTIMMGFPSIIDNSIYNSILLDITCKYIKNVCMDVLRAKENLIYGIDVISSINYCGTTVKINLNVSNENAKKDIY